MEKEITFEGKQHLKPLFYLLLIAFALYFGIFTPFILITSPQTNYITLTVLFTIFSVITYFITWICTKAIKSVISKGYVFSSQVQAVTSEFKIPISDIESFYIKDFPLFTKLLGYTELNIKTKSGKNYFTKGSQVVRRSLSADYQLFVSKDDKEKIISFFKARGIKLRPPGAITKDLKGLPYFCMWLQLVGLILLVLTVLEWFLLHTAYSGLLLLLALLALNLLTGFVGVVQKRIVKIDVFYFITQQRPLVLVGGLAVFQGIIKLFVSLVVIIVLIVVLMRVL